MDEHNLHRYTKEQILSFSLLLIFGILVVGLAALQVRNTIYGPFVLKLDTLEDPNTAALFENDQTKLQSIDTDQDGLNDYEELQFYTTSPYLPDTDSDGIDDKTEIQNGTDPLCPEGDPCESRELDATPDAGITPVLGDAMNPLASDAPAPTAQAPDILSDLETLIDNPAALRETILRTGAISKSELDTIDDAAIIDLAKQIIAQRFGSSETPEESSESNARSTSTSQVSP